MLQYQTMSKDREEITLSVKLFLEASVNRSASVTAQAAYIADYCQDHKLEPSELVETLDDDQIIAIFTAASKMHSKLPFEKHPGNIFDKITPIYGKDFALAQDFMVLNKSQLKEIKQLYEKKARFYDATNQVSDQAFEDYVRNKFGLPKRKKNIIPAP